MSSSQRETPGVVHITPRPRRQSITVEHYSAILGSSATESLIEPPSSADCYQTIPVTTTNMSEDGKYIVPESSLTVLEERQNVLLKRRSSWRRFKDRVVGWVSGGSSSNDTEHLIPTGVPTMSPHSLVDIPGESRSSGPLVIEDAEALLKSTNCYSSGRKLSPTPLSTSPDIPKIIVTSDKIKPQEEEIRKKMAVAKIKEAITSMNSSEDVSHPIPDGRESRESRSQTPSGQRRHSSAYDTRRKNSEDIHLSGRRGSGPNLRRTHSAKLGKAKPMIWEHFEKVPGNSTIGKCKECHMAVSCKYNTGQFVRHLQNSHKDVYRKYQSKMDSAWAQSVIEKNLK